jgi:hypothetical protein
MAEIIGAIIGGLAMWLLMRSVRRTARQSGSRSVLEYGPMIRGLGVVLLIVGGFLLFAASRASADQRQLAWIVSGALAGAAVYFFIEVFFVRIEFDDTWIYATSPWRADRAIPWSDITECRYSHINRWHVIRTRDNGTLRLSVYLSGVDTFLERVARRRC